MYRNPVRLLLMNLIALSLLSACAPRLSANNPVLNSTQALGTAKTAQIAYHRMEIGLLQTGDYTTNALLELQLPQGVRWTLQDFNSQGYELYFTSDAVGGYAWSVSPSGVRRLRLR